MAYSSLIRESEDLGAGIFDVNGRELCESDSTPMHMRLDPGLHPRHQPPPGRHLPGGRRRSCTTTRTTGRRTRPTTAVVIPIFWERRARSASPAARGTSPTSAATSPALCMDVVDVWAEAQAAMDSMKIYRRRRAATTMLDPAHPRQRAHPETEPRRPGAPSSPARASARSGSSELLERYGLDTVMSASRASGWTTPSEMLRARDPRRSRTARYEAPLGYLDDDGTQPRRPAQGGGARRGRR